jgi:hypothetical protein
VVCDEKVEFIEKITSDHCHSDFRFSLLWAQMPIIVYTGGLILPDVFTDLGVHEVP